MVFYDGFMIVSVLSYAHSQKLSWNLDICTGRRTQIMKLFENLKEKAEGTRTKEEKRELIEKAGMKLDETELEQVAGGAKFDKWIRETE